MNNVYFPFFFDYRDRVFGKGFMADVISHGRILAATEDDEHWVYGVEPGGLAATGGTPHDALNAYRGSFHNVLIDLAEESESSEAFEAGVKAMFSDINAVREREWRTAVEAVRAGKIKIDAPRKDADSECYVRVGFNDLEHVLPADNYPITRLERVLAA